MGMASDTTSNLLLHSKGLLTTPLFNLAEAPVSLASLLIAALIIVAGLFMSRVVQKVLRKYLFGKLSIDSGVGYAFLRVAHYTIVASAWVIALQSIGIKLGSLTVFGGFLGVGLGFGMQNLTSNFVSGIILLFERPIQIGDKITVGEHIGTVESIGMRSTTISTFDNITLILPNSIFVEHQVINWSHGDPRVRLHIPFGIAYGTNIEKARKAALGAVEAVESALVKPSPDLRFLGFGDSSLDFELLVWIKEPRLQFKIKSDIYFHLEAALRQAGIEIPFPQRDVHVRSKAAAL